MKTLTLLKYFFTMKLQAIFRSPWIQRLARQGESSQGLFSFVSYATTMAIKNNQTPLMSYKNKITKTPLAIVVKIKK